MARQSLRDDIISAGLRVMLVKGYSAASVRDIVAEAGAPQGSFTNHFPTKEAFSIAVLDAYFDHIKTLVAQAFESGSLSPRARLIRYLDIITDILERDGLRRGCLIGDFSAEATQLNEAVRLRLEQIFVEWRDQFAACIAEGQSLGEIDKTFDPVDLADFLLSSWEGAILRMKVERRCDALERFKKIAFATVFKEVN
ncbi:TetR family transcriptional regulator [Pleomorphomonas diazotrophica]|uniref:TetR family transcriptional regulator n=1 Tax=Pleomorphomonas diazotrophica TaxID=1166257 RepID=A0A2N3M232_9HYPH|nr:TetR/AcrR family transcriptional regulator [Pleomorphomonas diazotrophica]PKR90941.1 TetR family transcriptional regulator [Pleomorphomonas diazotrophica]